MSSPSPPTLASANVRREPLDAANNGRAAASACNILKVFNYFNWWGEPGQQSHSIKNLSPPSQERLEHSLTEQPYDTGAIRPQDFLAAEEKGKTVLYLAYGSNLCKETFRGKRGIKPISQINVQVPELRLTFDLPGIPYTEPCFANTARRDPTEPPASEKEQTLLTGPQPNDYHKDRWKKGLVGVVYEVTPIDYAHIIATEGGGASYKDILVTCYPLPTSRTVPEAPTTPPFRAHTLFAPLPPPPPITAMRPQRSDPSYAQPSARYLKLITDGASELGLPAEYQNYLADIRPYTIMSPKQRLGQFIFLAIWSPFLVLMLALQAQYQDEKGRSPKWLAQLSAAIFNGVWTSYDGFFKDLFGDGERTQKCQHERGEERRYGRRRGWFRMSRDKSKGGLLDEC
ncbi:hypothetical protein AOQ84DRAFT_353555 [Glonium stellatum]|uniref:gamma-glutamylcyclotransferase n=1 Tax=Glonium stellatum TaxID=574774 RepID=A0A8E2JUQ4_9PEZI|nr:hypothetical protein AOQ84DRAFT_353555 [Glonium stellatum]